MTTIDTVPDNPTDPEAAALELIVRVPQAILANRGELAVATRITEVLQDYCSVLDAKGASRTCRGPTRGLSPWRSAGTPATATTPQTSSGTVRATYSSAPTTWRQNRERSARALNIAAT